jgi:hypothetical protein
MSEVCQALSIPGCEGWSSSYPRASLWHRPVESDKSLWAISGEIPFRKDMNGETPHSLHILSDSAYSSPYEVE